MKKKYFNSNIESPILFRDKSIIGILHIVSSFTAQTALIYLDFIVKTIGKSCKSASIMFIYFLNTIPFCNKLLKCFVRYIHRNISIIYCFTQKGR